MQQYTMALQTPKGLPRKSRTVTRNTAGRIGLSLTLRKFYLATLLLLLTLQIIYNQG